MEQTNSKAEALLEQGMDYIENDDVDRGLPYLKQAAELGLLEAQEMYLGKLILSEDSVMKVKCHTNSGSHAIVSVDGNNVFRLSAEDTVIVSKSKYFVEIIDISGGSFFSSINKKLMQPLKESAEDGI